MEFKHLMYLRDFELSFYNTFLEYSKDPIAWNSKFFERFGL